MVTYYKDDSTNPARAQQIYLILIGAAHRREILTYGHVRTLLGYSDDQGAQFLRGMLGPIMRWCKEHNLPALTSIVVNKSTGLPGDGLTTVDGDGFAAEQQRVFRHDWYALHPPSIAELKG